MADLKDLIQDLFKHRLSLAEAGKVRDEAQVNACREWVKYKHLDTPNVSYDAMKLPERVLVEKEVFDQIAYETDEFHGSARMLSSATGRLPEGDTKTKLLTFNQAFDRARKADGSYVQSSQTLAKYLGVDRIEVDRDHVLVHKRQNTVSIPKDHFTPEGLQIYRDSPVLKSSRIWEELPKGATGLEAATTQAVAEAAASKAANPATQSAVETWAEKVVKPVSKTVPVKPPVAESVGHFKSAIRHGNVDEYAKLLSESGHPSAETFARQTRKLSAHLKNIGAAAENGAVTNLEAALNTLKRSRILAQVENIASHIRI